MKDFFVSYNRNDREWAEWIAWQLEVQGYTAVIQAWDFRPGGNFVLDMQEAAAKAQRTIAVLSPAYLESRFTAPEWAAAFARDPTGSKRILVPVRVRECEPTGLLPQIVYIDLVGLDEQNAKERLLQGVKSERAKPSAPPRYPGHVHDIPASRPVFPGPPPPAAALITAKAEDKKQTEKPLSPGGTITSPSPEPAIATPYKALVSPIPIGTLAYIKFVAHVEHHQSAKQYNVRLMVEVENNSDSLLRFEIKRMYGVVNGKTVPDPSHPDLGSGDGYVYPHKKIYLMYERIDDIDMSSQMASGSCEYLINYSTVPQTIVRKSGRRVLFQVPFKVSEIGGPQSPVGSRQTIDTMTNISNEIEE